MRLYKSPTINRFGFGGEYLPRAEAEAVIADANQQWTRLNDKQGVKR